MNNWAGFKNKLLSHFINIIEQHNFLNLSSSSSIHSSVILKGVRISGTVNIGEGCKITNGVKINAGSNVSLGRYTSLNGPNMDITCKINPVTVGSFCSIARNVSIQEFNHRFDGVTTYHIHKNILMEGRMKDIYSNGAVEIGNDVWIGTQCVITSGAKIGNGAVIAANSVVTDEIPPYAIAAGSPARVIKFRFSDARMKEIEEMKWWDWDLNAIRLNREYFN